MLLRVSKAVKRSQRIAPRHTVWLQTSPGKVSNGFMIDTLNRCHGYKSSFFTSIFATNQNWRFTLCASASFAFLLAANQRIINLNQLTKPIQAIAMPHGCTDLAQH